MPAVNDPLAPPPRTPSQAAGPPAANIPAASLDRVLATLRQALAGGETEPICGAYHALRQGTPLAARAKLPEWLQQTLGLEAYHAVVGAHAHLHCFMCTAGLAHCASCEGAGHDEGDPCPYCRGLGFTPCTFCRGTGWADRNILPEELRPAILHRQLLGVRGYAAQLSGVFARLRPDALRALPPARQRRLAAELLRLRSRLTDMTETAGLTPDARGRLTGAARKVGNVLRALSRPGPR